MKRMYFVKEFQLSRRLQRAMMKVSGETDKEYEKRVKIARYGIEGEDRTYYQLSNIYLPLVALSDVRIDEKYGNAQVDFFVISNKKIFILEVKNLYGNIRVNDNGEVIRLIPRGSFVEEVGMENPFTQSERQAIIFQKLLSYNGYDFPIEYLIVMGNPHTAIYFEKKKYPIIRYDKLNSFFDSVVDDNCTVLEYNKLIEIGEFVNSRHKGRNYNAYQKVHKAMVTKTNNNPNFTGKELLLYEDLLEYRRNLAIEKKMPLCNIFLNREAEQMVLLKPKNAEELMSIPGIKTKKFLLFGEDVLAIIKKYL